MGALILLVAVACGPGRTPAPNLPPTTIQQTAPTATQTVRRTPAPNLSLTTTAVAFQTVYPPPPPTPTPSPTAIPGTLTLCLADEPQSLYLYAKPEAGRAHILAALYDGPIDSVNYAYQPVLLEKLPSLSDGDALTRTVTLYPGDTLVDSLGRVVTLTLGVVVPQMDGGSLTYSGEGSLTAPQMVVTFHLKPGVLWSDGAPLTSADSVFSYNISRHPDSYNPLHTLAERTASYHVIDSVTLEWVGLPGYLDPLYFTNFWTPLPHHLYPTSTGADLAADENANHNPLGWGAFILKEWVKGDHLTFERNPLYFRAAEGLPKVNEVTYRIVPDRAQIFDDLSNRKCDVAPSSPVFDGISPSAGRGGPLAESGVNLDFTDSILEHLDFGIAPVSDYAREVGNDFFQDLRARQAIAHCLYRGELASLPGLSFYAGWEPPFTYLPNDNNDPFYFRPTPVAYYSDPARGRALLAEMGWTDSDGDGTLEKNGKPLKLSLVGGPVGDSLREGLLTEIQTELKANCGIVVETRLLTQGELAADWPDGVIFGRRFDLALFGWNVGVVPPCALFTTAQIASDSNPGGANDTGYSNPDFDAACQRALLPPLSPPTLFWDTRQSEAAKFHFEAQDIFARDLPLLPLFFRIKTAAVRREVADFTLDSTSPSELWNIETLKIAP